MFNKYLDVEAYIKDLLKIGKLSSGNKAPSIREICRISKCSKSTAIKAYDNLQKEHVLYSVPKSGYFVVKKDLTDKKHDSKLNSEDFCFCSYNNSTPKETEFTIDFSSTSLDANTSSLPQTELQHSIDYATNTYSNQLLSYPLLEGILGLRKALQKHLQNQQVFTNIDNIFITSGTQQSLFLLCKMPFPNCRLNVLVEQPTYFGMIKALELNNVKALGIERKSDGIDINELERIFKSGEIKFFYLISRYQNPTGFSYTREQKNQILKLAEKYDVYIVEDDYLGDLDIDSKCDPLYSYSLSNRVIYLKSFSKTLMPGLRISVAVLPSLLVDKFKEYKACCDIGPTILSQGILEVCLNSGMYDVHIKRMKDLYRKKMQLLNQSCVSMLSSECYPHSPKTGVFSCITLPQNINVSTLINTLQHKGVLVSNVDNAFLPGYRINNIIRLSICKVDELKIKRGIQIISDTLKTNIGYQNMGIKFTMSNFHQTV